MKRQRGCSLLVGLALVLVGAWFLIVQIFPDLALGIDLEFTWPWIFIGLGALLLIFGLVVGAPGMAIPASITAGLGAIFYYQSTSGDWSSWAYLWTLIPAFVGIGILLMGLLQGNLRRLIFSGFTLILISLVLFMIFASLLGGPALFGPYWPVLLILLGAWLLLRVFLPRK